jgi:hypothetical protein
MSSTTEPIKSSHKHKAPIDDNGEPVVVNKRKKAVLGSHPAKKQKNAPTKTVTRTGATTTAPSTSATKTLPAKKFGTNQQVPTRSVSVEDVFDEEDHPRSIPPRNPRYILESVDSEEEHEDDESALAMDVDDNGEPEKPEEDDDAELG